MKTHATESMGQRLKRLRLQAGITIAEAARTIGVSTSTYREWEYGRSIRGEPYAKIAQTFNVGLYELLIGEQKIKSRALDQADIIESAIKKLKIELMELS